MATHYDAVPTGVGACVFYCYNPGKVVESITMPPLMWNQNTPSRYWFTRPGEIVDNSAAMTTRVVQFGFQFRLTANIVAMKASVAEAWIQGICKLQQWIINNPNKTDDPEWGIYCFPHIDNQDVWFKVAPVGDFQFEFINGKATGLSSVFECVGLDILSEIPIGTSLVSQWGSRTIAYDATIDYPYLHQWAKRTGDLIDFGGVQIGDAPPNWTLDGGLTFVAERFMMAGAIVKCCALTGAGAASANQKATWDFTAGVNPTIYAMLRPRQAGGDASFGLIFRKQAGGNHYYFRLDTAAASAYLIKNIGGVDTTLDTFAGLGRFLAIQRPVWAKIVPLNNLIKLYLARPFATTTPLGTYYTIDMPTNWEFIGSVTDASITLTGSSGIRAGFGSEMNLIRYYDSLADYASTDYTILGNWTRRSGKVLPFTP